MNDHVHPLFRSILSGMLPAAPISYHTPETRPAPVSGPTLPELGLRLPTIAEQFEMSYRDAELAASLWPPEDGRKVGHPAPEILGEDEADFDAARESREFDKEGDSRENRYQ
jgi:hypothetical protein